MISKRNLAVYDRGSVTFVIMMLCTSILICTAAMLAVSEIHLGIETNRGFHQVVYAAARGVALSDIRQLKNGQTPQSDTKLIGKVFVHSNVMIGSLVSVRVTAAYQGATDIISFTYDTISKKLTHWQDNGPTDLAT